MITCDFQKIAGKGLCDTLVENIKKQIINQSLKANEKLPSKRALAEHLGVSVITVANAYGQLISEGYLYSEEKKGFYVSDIGISRLDSNQKQRSHEIESGVEVEPFVEDCILKLETQNINHENIDFRSNSTSYEKFPFSIWSKISRSVLNSPHENLLKAIPSVGVFELRKEISDYLRKFRNMNVSPSQIFIGAGTEYLYSQVVYLLGRNCLFGVENPGYNKTSKVIEINGAKCVPIPIDSQGIITSFLETTKVTVVHVSPSHHFPTGAVMPIGRRNKLLGWLTENNTERFIIEDDYDSEFRFSGKPLPTLQSSDSSGRVIYINTFTKTLSPSFRISYMVLPISLVSLFYEKLGFSSCTVSSFEQYTLAAFMNQAYYEKHIIRMKNYYRNLRNSLIYAIEASPLSKITSIREEDSGLHFLLLVKTSLSGNELRKQFEKYNIHVSLLSDFFYETVDSNNLYTSTHKGELIKPDKTLVINYSGINKNAIPYAIKALEMALLTE